MTAPSKPLVIWFTGLSGAGKSTLAEELSQRLSKDYSCQLLDGDILRQKKPQIGFSVEDRIQHNKDVVRMCAKNQQHQIILVAMITPFEQVRQFARQQITNYFEVYVSTPLETCERRDPKGLYKKVRSGEIKNFTGVDQKYEAPTQANLEIDTTDMDLEKSIKQISESLHGHLSS